jgi:transposase InsO family protein
VLRRPLESAQYTSAEFARWCCARRVHTSMGRTGVCWDNAAAESFFETLKNEMYYQHVFPSLVKGHEGLPTGGHESCPLTVTRKCPVVARRSARA